MNTPPVAGWFGKIPALGDFAARRLPDAFVQAWDDWLQHGLAAAHETLVDAPLAEHEVPPIRRFWLGRGVIDDACWTGALMPSFDRVGRRFPLTVAFPTDPQDGQPASLAAALHANAWFADLEGLLRDVRVPGSDVEQFELALATLGASLAAADADSQWTHAACELLRPFAPPARAKRQGRKRFWRLTQKEDADADVALVVEPQPCSVWWRDGSHEEGGILSYGGLPPAEELGALLAVRTDRGVAPT